MHETDEDRRERERLRFERYPTTDVAIGSHCPCWRPAGGPYLEHPAGCLCPCHGGRTEG